MEKGFTVNALSGNSLTLKAGTEEQNADKKISGTCGLFCSSCTLYIATTEEPYRLKALSKRFGRPEGELKCLGCRSETVSFFCKSCLFKKCAAERGIEFCGSCKDFPCPDLRKFQSEAPHRAELWKSLETILENGFEYWFAKEKENHSCGSCHAVNSVYDPVCRKCGNSPSSPFFENNREKITSYISPSDGRK